MASLRRVNITLFSLMLLLTRIDGFCNVCGTGLKVGNPNAIFEYPGRPASACGDLEDAGERGYIPQDTCPFLPELIHDTCDCYRSNRATSGQPCYVCGAPGYRVNSPKGMVKVPGFPLQSCLEIEILTERRLIGHNDAVCSSLPDLMDEFCSGCYNSRPDRTPVGSPAFYFPTPTPLANFRDFREDDQDDSQPIFLTYLIIGTVGAAGSILICCACGKQQAASAIGATNNNSNNNTETNRTATVIPAISESQLVENAKLRPLVLKALFPEQKMGVAAVGAAAVDVDSPNDPENTTRSIQAPCSICLEQLDENDSVVFGSSCSHMYHRDCILQWLNSSTDKKNKQKHDDCPNCRQRMWDPDTYELVQENVRRQQNAREQESHHAEQTEQCVYEV